MILSGNMNYCTSISLNPICAASSTDISKEQSFSRVNVYGMYPTRVMCDEAVGNIDSI